jgi:hypothetical protein
MNDKRKGKKKFQFICYFDNQSENEKPVNWETEMLFVGNIKYFFFYE